MRVLWRVFGIALFLGLGTALSADEIGENNEARPPSGDDELAFWLENMVRHHGYSDEEVAAVAGMSVADVGAAVERLGLRQSRGETSPRDLQGRLVVLPYPGGRHPRIGFLDGAVRPQRETKFSVFTPWEPRGYVVVDVPEAIWSNLGLTYLAHTHIPTIWTTAGVELDRLEWSRVGEGRLKIERRLPNGIAFAVRVRPERDAVFMELSLTNGTPETLTDLRIQNCVMFKGVPGFAEQTNDNKVFQDPYGACRSTSGNRWVITAWVPNHRMWGNAPCPCLHSDPKLPDCPPGETRRAIGRLSFYEGTDFDAEIRRIDATGWRDEVE